jgi:hypothetical protein
VFAMQATDRGEFIQDTPSLLAVARSVPSRQRNYQLVSCRHADPPHLRPHRCTPVGSKLNEATGCDPGAFQARQCARRENLDCRAAVTSITGSSAQWLYDSLYCARGQAENLIKLHKTQLASDRTSCRSPLANQVRLVLHTGAYWLMLTVRDAIPRPQPLATAEFTTLRARLIKIAARITETASRVRVAFAAAHPEAALFTSLSRRLHPAGP